MDSATAAGALVLVTNGTYETGARVVYGSMNNRVVVAKPLIVRSVNGPQATAIKGNGPLGDGAIRCAYLGTKASLEGFTLTNGYTRASGDVDREQSGGGVWCEITASLSNCAVVGNAAGYGGGVYFGTLNNCTLFGNSASSNGGGVYFGTLNNCTLSGNSAAADGGGAYRSTLNNCVLSTNSALDDGGGAYRSTLNNCILSANSALDDGGGAYDGTLNNCVLRGNIATDQGGGVRESALYNCTVYGNSAARGGGVAYCDDLFNSIIWYNTATNYPNYQGSMSYSCTTPDPGGMGNIAGEPQFVDAPNDNLRLMASSPCIDRGANAYAPGAADFDGNTRIVNWVADMGAYEYQGIVSSDTDGDGIPNEWETMCGLDPAISNAPGANADGDDMTDFEEYVADTCPTNAASYLRITAVSNIPPMQVRFESSSNRRYTLQFRTNLLTGLWTNVTGQGPRTGVGGEDSMVDSNSEPPRFYRLEGALP